MSENEYTTIWPKPDKTTYYSHSSSYSIVYNEDGEPTKTIVNHDPVCHDYCIYTIKNDDAPTIMNKSIQTENIAIHFRDGESAYYNNAYDLQDFLNQVNHYHDLRKNFQIVVNKLLESRPELEEWVEKNFKQYLKEDN